MGRKKRQQSDQRADLRGGGFVGLPRAVHKSDAYSSLNVFERAVLVEILAVFNGYNNGKLVISQRQIAERLGNSNYGKIGRAIGVLMMHGLLDLTSDSIWKERRAREYRLTFINTGSPPNVRPATNEYVRWRKNDDDEVSAEPSNSAGGVSASVACPAAPASASIA